jgi:hypothetical protein
MEFFSTIMRVVGPAIGALFPKLKQRRAERLAGQNPSDVPDSIADDLFDSAMRRLGTINQNDPFWRRCITGIEATYVRPELFARPSVREWLSNPEVRSGIKLSAEAFIARRDPPLEIVARLADLYSDATGENGALADHPIRIAVAFLSASVQAVTRDHGTAATVLAVASGLSLDIQKVDAHVLKLAEKAGLTVSPVVSERFTHEGRQDLEGILRRRVTPGQQPVMELTQLLREFDAGGRLSAADEALHDDVKYWLARMEAATGNFLTSENLLLELQRSGYLVPAAAWALVDFAKGDHKAALRRVRDLHDAESRTVLFHTLLKSEGPAIALQFVEQFDPIPPSFFTPTGWNNICVTLLSEKRIGDAAKTLSALPREVLEQCTNLYYMYAVSLLLPLLPVDRHASLFSYGISAVAEHALDGPESRKALAAALSAAHLARQCALEWKDVQIAERCGLGIRGLRLLDPATKTEESAKIAEEMKDGESGIYLLKLARAHSIQYDSRPLEAYLDRAQTLGGLTGDQIRAKLYLLDEPSRYPDLIKFMDDEWSNLLPDNNIEALVIIKVQALAFTGDTDGASSFLEKHLDEIGDAVSSRLRIMISDARGEDPTDAAVRVFSESNAIEDLHNVVQVLVGRKRWKKLAPFSEQLYSREPNFESAMLRYKCLGRSGASAREICEFLEGTVDVVEQRAEIRSARAWATFEFGDHAKAKQLNDALLSERDDAIDVALDVNLAIRTGDWDRFPAIAARALQGRSKLNARMLLSLAQLVGFSDPTQALVLAQEAVARDPENPAVLIGANSVAIAARGDHLAMPWVHKAAQLSKRGGPVTTFSYREMVEFMRRGAESWRQKHELYRTAQVPLHAAAQLFNTSLSQLLIAIPRQNAREADPRRRQPVPLLAGGRPRVDPHAISRISLDLTSLFVLSELRKLSNVLEFFETVFVSPRLMEVLLDDRRKVAFHQPSRVAQVKPLSTLVSAGRLRIVDSKAERSLVDEVGEEAAALLTQAKAYGGVFVHPGALFKVSSYMDEEANLGELQEFLADPIDVVTALAEEGVITQSERDEGIVALQPMGMVARGTFTSAVPLFLDGLAVHYLQQANLVQALLNSAHEVWIYRSTVDEWQALLATEPVTEEITAAIDDVRRAVRSGLMSGKVKFLAQSRKQRDRLSNLPLLPMADLLEDTAQIDFAVIDDRMLGANMALRNSSGHIVPVLSSLDVLKLLLHKGALSETAHREAYHLLRSRCFFCIPLSCDDLLFYLGQAAVVDGKVRETAELRTIRQYFARLNSTDVLCTPADLTYHDSIWRMASLAIVRIWQNESIAASDASTISDWIATHVLPELELVMHFAPDAESRFTEVAASQLSVSLWAPSSNRQRQKDHSVWLERARLSALLPGNVQVLDLAVKQVAEQLVKHNAEMTVELENADSADSAE